MLEDNEVLDLELENFTVYLDKDKIRFMAMDYEPSFTASKEEIIRLVEYLQKFIAK